MRLPSIVIIWFTWICLRSLVIDRLSEGDERETPPDRRRFDLRGFCCNMDTDPQPRAAVVSALPRASLRDNSVCTDPVLGPTGSVFAITALALAVHQTACCCWRPQVSAATASRSQHSNAFPSLAWASMIGFRRRLPQQSSCTPRSAPSVGLHRHSQRRPAKSIVPARSSVLFRSWPPLSPVESG